MPRCLSVRSKLLRMTKHSTISCLISFVNILTIVTLLKMHHLDDQRHFAVFNVLAQIEMKRTHRLRFDYETTCG